MNPEFWLACGIFLVFIVFPLWFVNRKVDKKAEEKKLEAETNLNGDLVGPYALSKPTVVRDHGVLLKRNVTKGTGKYIHKYPPIPPLKRNDSSSKPVGENSTIDPLLVGIIGAAIASSGSSSNDVHVDEGYNGGGGSFDGGGASSHEN